MAYILAAQRDGSPAEMIANFDSTPGIADRATGTGAMTSSVSRTPAMSFMRSSGPAPGAISRWLIEASEVQMTWEPSPGSG